MELATLLGDVTRSDRLVINWNMLRISPHTWGCTFSCCNVYEVHNRWRQLYHLHRDSSPYDHTTFLDPSAASLELMLPYDST
jgi:hypothetical protein